MKIYFIILIAFSTCLLVACKGRQTAKGKIFERKEIEENKLMIKYTYLAEGKSFSDSAVIDNTVLNSDSIAISYDPSNPSETMIVLPE